MLSIKLAEYLRDSLLSSTVLVLASLSLGYSLFSSIRRKNPLPPGPPCLPIVGNIFDVPATEFWKKYLEWSKKYGSDIIYLNMFGTPVVILNSLDTAQELLDRRSSIYSCRPNMTMLTELVKVDWNFGLMKYGTKWKESRKCFQQHLHPSKSVMYRSSLLASVKATLNGLLDDPDHFLDHGRRQSGSFILDISYGIDLKSKADEVYIVQAEQGMSAISHSATTPYLVDFFPALRYVPSWVPGAGFQLQAKSWRKTVADMADMPLNYVRDALATGNAKKCVATDLLEDFSCGNDITGSISTDKEEIARAVLASMYAGGSDTNVSLFSTFILAMVQNPDIQKKAQDAIDAEISLADGLPDFSTYGKIPYVEGIVRETMRWQPVMPICVPHRVTQDDVYNGYHIPAGATVIANAWAILYDPKIYGPNPSVFDPSRFLDETQTRINPKMPMGYEGFGFGRRICPGIHIAVDTFWITVVSILLAFDIKAVEGSPGSKEPHPYSSGLIRHPFPFKCLFVPRSELAIQAIRGN